jgi:hypothetical protein
MGDTETKVDHLIALVEKLVAGQARLAEGQDQIVKRLDAIDGMGTSLQSLETRVLENPKFSIIFDQDDLERQLKALSRY